METREALARLSLGESLSDIAEDTGIVQSILLKLYNGRREADPLLNPIRVNRE
jgi:cytoskeletal protein RodZ